ncbi:M23 family metallopeptidase [Candidatus Pacearchaeota archaeon]|nr:M23 family metallopeptidase [Candidatus Pacearchaeota archaeon]
MISYSEEVGSSCDEFSYSNFLSRKRIFIFILLSSLSPNYALGQENPNFEERNLEQMELVDHPMLKALDYRNIDQLDVSKVDVYLTALKEAIKDGQLTIEDLREKIFPPSAYASGLYFSDHFLMNVLPQRIKEQAGMTDAYTESLRHFVSDGKIAKQNQVKHEQLFSSYIRIFGTSIDISKTSHLFEEWGIKNMPSKREFWRDHKDAIDIYYPFKEVDGEHFGPPVLAQQSGVVIAAENGWSGGRTKLSYKGGGMGGKTGNGVIIFNPQKREYTYYAHFNKVDVRLGDIIEAGQVIGHGGNTGIDARKPCCGRHVHFEIHRYNEKGEFEFVPKEELYEILSGRKP